MHDRTWSTDRNTAARRWAELDPPHADEIARLLGWAEGRSVASAAELAAALRPNGVVAIAADRFAAEIGLWADSVAPDQF